MAKNLVKARHRVRAWDTSADVPRPLPADDAAIADGAGAAFRGDAGTSMLPNDDATRAVFSRLMLARSAPIARSEIRGVPATRLRYMMGGQCRPGLRFAQSTLRPSTKRRPK
jgi:3-hydroxyisobutyrate dehydrogenase-like beta-hydroxyacid dehydrogenase